jgi:hypothetical protein
MTHDDIIRMAQEAGFQFPNDYNQQAALNDSPH